METTGQTARQPSAEKGIEETVQTRTEDDCVLPTENLEGRQPGLDLQLHADDKWAQACLVGGGS